MRKAFENADWILLYVRRTFTMFPATIYSAVRPNGLVQRYQWMKSRKRIRLEKKIVFVAAAVFCLY